MTGKHIAKTPSGRAALPAHLDAVRAISITGRRTFTDSVKTLCNYTDPAGNISTSNGKAYVHFTRQLYRCFGLSEKQAEARLNGECLRDMLDQALLASIHMAEIECASLIDAAIKNQELRSDIKKQIKACFEHHAQTWRRIYSNWQRSSSDE